MKKEIMVGDKPMNFEATALFPHAMREVFKINVFKALQGMDLTDIKSDSDDVMDLVSQMAFIMNKTAELSSAREILSLTQDDYFEWLNTIESFALVEAMPDLMDVYMSSKKSDSNAKNPESLQ